MGGKFVTDISKTFKKRTKQLNKERTHTANMPQKKSRDERWMDNYLDYQENVERGTKQSPRLRNWINRQRVANRQRKLSQKRIELLNDIGFIWNPLFSKLVSKASQERYLHEANQPYYVVNKRSRKTKFREKWETPEKTPRLKAPRLCPRKEKTITKNEKRKKHTKNTYQDNMDKSNPKGCMSRTTTTTTTRRYRKYLNANGRPIQPDEHICHIIAKANGGADHPLNYCVASSKINKINGRSNDAYYVGIVGLTRAREAVRISRELNNYTGPDAETLFEIACNCAKQTRRASKL